MFFRDPKNGLRILPTPTAPKEVPEMNRKTIVMALFIAVMSTTGYAEPVDNSTYFQGVWSGTWPTGSDVTITIGKKNEEGTYDTKYSWGFGKRKDAVVIPPGSITASGRVQGEEFIIEWKDKEGTKMDIKLEKYKDDVVKAKVTREGPVIKAGYRPYLDTYLKRK